MYLPGNWPTGPAALANPRHAWPYQSMQRLAAYPHQHRTWYPPVTIIDLGSPLSPETRMSVMMLRAEANPFSKADLADGRTVVFYTLTPLYPEERDVEKREGIARLLDLFDRQEVEKVVNVQRRSVVK